MEAIIATNENTRVSLGKAALVAGFSILIMVLTVPIVEFYIFPTLIDYKNAAQTTQNISNQQRLFSTAIFIHFITVICDIVITWALYIFFKPVNKSLSLLVSWFRLAYTAFNVAAILNLIQILGSIKASKSTNSNQSDYLNEIVMTNLYSFNLQWEIGLVFFGIYNCLLGYLAMQAKYIPKFISISIVIAGLGYLIEDLKYFFFPRMDTGFLWLTFFGELIFMFWLLIKGSRISETK